MLGTLLVIVIVAVAVLYLIRLFTKRGSTPCPGGCGCNEPNKCSAKNSPMENLRGKKHPGKQK